MSFDFLYVADDGYFNLLRLSLISCVKHHKGATFHVFTMDSPETKQIQISKKNKNNLKKEINSLDSTAQIVFYDVREMFLEKMGNSVNNDSEYTPFTALRLLAPYILKEIDMVLYLDADTIVVDSLNELFLDYKDEEFDIGSTVFIENKNKKTEQYILASTLLINLKYQRKTNFRFMNEAIDIYNKFSLEFPDQDAMTRACKKTITLDNKYNMFNIMDNYTKIIVVVYRSSEKVKTFVKQSVFHLAANRIYEKLDKIQNIISDIQEEENRNI